MGGSKEPKFGPFSRGGGEQILSVEKMKYGGKQQNCVVGLVNGQQWRRREEEGGREEKQLGGGSGGVMRLQPVLCLMVRPSNLRLEKILIADNV